MHPLGTYLAITDRQREYGGGQTKVRPAAFARVDALPIIEPEPVADGRRLTRPGDGQRRLEVRVVTNTMSGWCATRRSCGSTRAVRDFPCLPDDGTAVPAKGPPRNYATRPSALALARGLRSCADWSSPKLSGRFSMSAFDICFTTAAACLTAHRSGTLSALEPLGSFVRRQPGSV